MKNRKIRLFCLLLSSILTSVLVWSGGVPAGAATKLPVRIDLYINGKLSEGAAYSTDTFYVPLESIVAEMGDSLTWIEKPSSAVVKQSNGKSIQIIVANSKAIVDGKEPVPVSGQMLAYGEDTVQATPQAGSTLYVPYDTIQLVLGYPIELQGRGAKTNIFVGKLPDSADMPAQEPDYVVAGAGDSYSPNGTWTYIEGGFGGYALTDFIYGNQEYISIGARGTYAVSKNGKDWSSSTRFHDYYLSSIVWTGQQYVMWGSPNNNQYAAPAAFFSPDGKNWTREETDMERGLAGVQYAFGRYYGIDNYGLTYESPDGVKWKALKPSAKWKEDIGFTQANGLLIALSSSKAPFIAISKDGSQWTERSLSKPVSEVIWNGKQYVAVGEAGVFTSPDALNWSKTSGMSPGIKLYDIDYNGKTYVSTGYLQQKDYSKQPVVYTSTDLKTWKSDRMVGGQLVGRIIGTEQGFVGVSAPGSSRSVSYGYFSKDGKNWSVGFLGSPTGFRGMATNGKRAVFLGEDGAVLSTEDGIHYRKSIVLTSLGAPDFSQTIWDGKKFVATGSHGVYLSSDGLTWRFVPIRSGSAYESTHAIVRNGNKLVAFGLYGRVFTSSDGEKWTKIYNGNTKFIGTSNIIWDGKKYLATKEVASGQKLIYSSDGIVWKDAVMPKGSFSGMVVAKNSKGYVAIDGFVQNRVLVSKDGITWKLADNNLKDYDRTMTTYLDLANDQFITSFISSKEDTIAFSGDGTTWTVKPVVQYTGDSTFLLGGLGYVGKLKGNHVFFGGGTLLVPDLAKIEPVTVETVKKAEYE